tara:strand:+ start:2628 stop:3131 length:504 start_codon:yes stop_codon:yes gene_type:complete
MSDPALARTADHLRALLDFSFSRNSELLGAVAALVDLLDGAAVPNGREADRLTALKRGRELLDLARLTPPAQGLFVHHGKLVCELAGAREAVEFIREEATAASARLADLEDRHRALRVELTHVRAERDALRKLIGDDAVTARVMQAASSLIPQPRATDGPSSQDDNA